MSNAPIVEKCMDLCERANVAARFLGVREYHPAMPMSSAAAHELFADLRLLFFVLHWKAIEREAMLEAGAPRKPMGVAQKVQPAA